MFCSNLDQNHFPLKYSIEVSGMVTVFNDFQNCFLNHIHFVWDSVRHGTANENFSPVDMSTMSRELDCPVDMFSAQPWRYFVRCWVKRMLLRSILILRNNSKNRVCIIDRKSHSARTLPCPSSHLWHPWIGSQNPAGGHGRWKPLWIYGGFSFFFSQLCGYGADIDMDRKHLKVLCIRISLFEWQTGAKEGTGQPLKACRRWGKICRDWKENHSYTHMHTFSN